jgi:hypothetical protein
MSRFRPPWILGDRPKLSGGTPESSPAGERGDTLAPGGARRSGITVLLGSFGILLVLWCATLLVRYRDRDVPGPGSADVRATISIGNLKGDYAPAIANPIVPQLPSPFGFSEQAAQAGIDFVHVSGMTKERHYPTANGSGVAMFDFDNDGLLDLYFATGNVLPLGPAGNAQNRLYKNLGGNRFQDVTDKAGVGFRGYCNGVVVGDIDNDGDQDLFLCNYGPNVLYLNNGDGTFTDISKSAGIDVGRRRFRKRKELAGDRGTPAPAGDDASQDELVEVPNWSSGGAFLDYDNDGDLDLYVANYGEWVYPYDARFCTDDRFLYAPGEEKVRIYCSPRSIRPVTHILYRNNGDGTFTDVTTAAGVGRGDGRGFGVVTADLDGDGRIDIFVANDNSPNFLFRNRGDGTFDDATETCGAGFDGHGLTPAGMGVDAEDVDGDGLPELFVTNFEGEPNSLFANLGCGTFRDASPTSGMCHDSMAPVGWGCVLADFDSDGWPDCFVTNGHVDDNFHLLGRDVDYAQPALLHRNDQGARFVLATRLAGPYFDTKHVGRGLAYGDIDNDGDVDLVINQRGDRPALLRNDTQTSNRWIRLVLVGTASNRDAVGARVEVQVGGRTIVRQRKGGTSLESAHDPRLLIGVGPAEVITSLEIRWPSGAVTTAGGLATNKTYTFVERRP